MCGFLKTEMGIDFGYRLSKDIWGCGLGYEAASAVLNYGVASIGLKHCGRGNARQLSLNKILDKLGFVYQKDVIFDGLTYHKYTFSQIKINELILFSSIDILLAETINHHFFDYLVFCVTVA